MPPHLPLTLLAGLAATSASGVSSDGLDAHRWRNRVLVVMAPSAGDPRLVSQRRILDTAGAGPRERDLVVLVATGMSARADALRKRFGVPADAFRAVLVGKDGGAKLSESGPIAAERLFAVIDSMPMRQGEMRRSATVGAGR